MRARTYVIERKTPGQLSVTIGSTDSREHAEIIAEAALEVAQPCTVVTLCNGHQIGNTNRP